MAIVPDFAQKVFACNLIAQGVGLQTAIIIGPTMQSECNRAPHIVLFPHM